MADRSVKYQITAEDQAAISAFKRVQAETRAADRDAAKLNATLRQQQKEIKDVTSRTSELKSELAGMAQAAVGVAAVTAAFTKLHDAAVQARAEMKGAGADMRELAMGAGGGTKETQATLQGAARLGKAYGFKPGESAQIRDWAEDVSGGDKVKGKFLAREAMKLESLGVAREDVQAVMPSLQRQGYGAERASALVAGGMAEMNLSGRTAAKVAARGQEFGSAEGALAAAKVIRDKDVLTDRETAGAVDAAAEAMSSSKLSDALRKKYEAQGIDYDKASMSGKLADIESLYGSDAKKLQKKFDLSETGAKSLSTMIQNRGLIEQEQQKLAAIPQDYARQRLDVMKETPALKEYYDSRQRESDREYDTNFGKFAGDYRAQGERSRAGAERYEQNRYTRDFLTNGQGELNTLGAMTQQVETNPLVQGTVGILPTTAAQGALGIGGPGAKEMSPAFQEWTTALKENTEELRKNSAATNTNSKATGGGGDATGAPIDRNADL